MKWWNDEISMMKWWNLGETQWWNDEISMMKFKVVRWWMMKWWNFLYFHIETMWKFKLNSNPGLVWRIQPRIQGLAGPNFSIFRKSPYMWVLSRRWYPILRVGYTGEGMVFPRLLSWRFLRAPSIESFKVGFFGKLMDGTVAKKVFFRKFFLRIFSQPPKMRWIL